MEKKDLRIISYFKDGSSYISHRTIYGDIDSKLKELIISFNNTLRCIEQITFEDYKLVSRRNYHKCKDVKYYIIEDNETNKILYVSKRKDENMRKLRIDVYLKNNTYHIEYYHIHDSDALVFNLGALIDEYNNILNNKEKIAFARYNGAMFERTFYNCDEIDYYVIIDDNTGKTLYTNKKKEDDNMENVNKIEKEDSYKKILEDERKAILSQIKKGDNENEDELNAILKFIDKVLLTNITKDIKICALCDRYGVYTMDAEELHNILLFTRDNKLTTATYLEGGYVIWSTEEDSKHIKENKELILSAIGDYFSGENELFEKMFNKESIIKFC